MFPAIPRRWPATCARYCSGYGIQSITLADLFLRPSTWRQWSTCAAPDRLEPIDPFIFWAQCNLSPPPPERPVAGSGRRASVPCRMAVCGWDCGCALAVAAAQPGSGCVDPCGCPVRRGGTAGPAHCLAAAGCPVVPAWRVVRTDGTASSPGACPGFALRRPAAQR